ncbi:MAG: ATP-binding cassette domain-containing protein [Candidatus Sericytochromatia bacterium]|nr:ATP-binding cassette domain-containing protein [Candidatus Tanganyikabacteria bacterium]
MNGDILLEVRGVSLLAGGRILADDVDLAVRASERVCLVGPSGAGKSVLLKTVIGAMRPARGEIRLLGGEPAILPEGIARQLGMAFQDGALFPSMTVGENVALPLELAGLASEVRNRVPEVLRRVGLDDASDRRPMDLSGGMRKRAGLARALVMRPRLLLLDEPTSGLDPVTARDMAEVVADAAEDAGLLVVTHDPVLVARLGERVLVLEGGRLRPSADDPWWQAFLAASHAGPPC